MKGGRDFRPDQIRLRLGVSAYVRWLYQCTGLSIGLSIYLSIIIYLFIYLSICLYSGQRVCMFVCVCMHTWPVTYVAKARYTHPIHNVSKIETNVFNGVIHFVLFRHIETFHIPSKDKQTNKRSRTLNIVNNNNRYYLTFLQLARFP